MPPPGGGKGNAYRRDMGINEKYVELSRKSAQEVAQRAGALDNEKERAVLNIISSSAMKGSRKTEAIAEVRKALALCRKGIDPSLEKKLIDCSVAGCAHEHRFLCLTRRRRPAEPENGVRDAVWAAIDNDLREKRNLLVPLVRADAPPPRVPSQCAPACAPACALAVEPDDRRRGRGCGRGHRGRGRRRRQQRRAAAAHSHLPT